MQYTNYYSRTCQGTYEFKTKRSTGSLVVSWMQSQPMMIRRVQWKPSRTQSIYFLISSRGGTMKSECRVSWIAKMMMAIICSREGGCVYELTSLYDPTLFLRGTNSFLQHFQMHILQFYQNYAATIFCQKYASQESVQLVFYSVSYGLSDPIILINLHSKLILLYLQYLLATWTIYYSQYYSMGNQNQKQTTCSRLCNRTTVIDFNPDDILINQYIVPCQICNTQFKHNDLKQHIDLIHYATIQEQKNGNAVVQCLLCSQLTPDLINHATHLTDKHPFAIRPAQPQSKIYLQVQTESMKMHRRVEEWQLNKYKKSAAVKLESDKDFQIIKQISDNLYEAVVNGVGYLVHKQCKQYKGADFNAQLMEAEMVWFKIFKIFNQKKCKYYYLDVEAGQRNILCRSFIFLPNDNIAEI